MNSVLWLIYSVFVLMKLFIMNISKGIQPMTKAPSGSLLYWMEKLRTRTRKRPRKQDDSVGTAHHIQLILQQLLVYTVSYIYIYIYL